MCHNVREWGRIRLATLSWFWSDCDTMWHVYMDLVKPVSYISNHANTQFTHLWHMCHVQLKHGNTKEIHILRIVASGKVQYNRNPYVHWTMSTIPQIDICHNANFVITVGTASYDHNDNLQASGDDKGGVMTTLGFQCNDTQNTWLMFFDNSVLSMIFCYLTYSTTVNLLSKWR